MAVKVAVLLYMVFSVATGQNTSSGLFELNIVHYNDFHAHFEEVSPQGTVCIPSEGNCIGGFARLYTAVHEAFEAEPDSILLNAGDTFQGTIWYNFLRWNVSQHFMNMLPHDAHTLGNHEFDHDIDGLTPYLKRLNAPMLGANVNSTLEPRMHGLYQNHTVVQRRGRRIGIIGVLLRTFSAPIGNLIMEDELDAVNREAAILTAEGVDIIIVLSHCGLTSDMFLAANVVPEVDFIVGGHSHTLLYNGETPNGDNAIDSYPTVVTRPDGHKIPIVQASCYTRYLGNIKLSFDDEGRLHYWEGLPMFLGTSVVQDPRVMELLEPWREEVDSVGKEVLGVSRVTLNRSWCFRGECNLGDFVCDGYLEELMHQAEGTAWHNTHICLTNAGGLRVQIDPGNVTTEALLMAVPFENYVQTFDLRGDIVLEALEHAVGTFQTPGAFYSARMLQVGGLRVAVNASMPAGSRVVLALVRCIECDVPRYEPLDLSATYRVVTVDYIADGGSGFTMLAEHRENVENLELDYVMLQRYMRRQRSLVTDLDGRIHIVF